MSRITANIFTQYEYPCGRLVMLSSYDSAERVAEFVMPSLSRGNRVYKLEVDCISCEVVCACESALCNLHSLTHREEYGTALEILALQKGYWYLPTITRRREALCIHSQRVQRWFWRHGLKQVMLDRETALMEKLLTLPDKRAIMKSVGNTAMGSEGSN